MLLVPSAIFALLPAPSPPPSFAAYFPLNLCSLIVTILTETVFFTAKSQVFEPPCSHFFIAFDTSGNSPLCTLLGILFSCFLWFSLPTCHHLFLQPDHFQTFHPGCSQLQHPKPTHVLPFQPPFLCLACHYQLLRFGTKESSLTHLYSQPIHSISP